MKEHGEIAMCAAVLHDTLEDTELKWKDIDRDFGTEIGDIVLDLSRDKFSGETYMEFIHKIKMSRNPLVEIIKIADLQDNLGRITCLPKEEQTIANRYIRALKVLGVKYER